VGRRRIQLHPPGGTAAAVPQHCTDKTRAAARPRTREADRAPYLRGSADSLCERGVLQPPPNRPAGWRPPALLLGGLLQKLQVGAAEAGATGTTPGRRLRVWSAPRAVYGARLHRAAAPGEDESPPLLLRSVRGPRPAPAQQRKRARRHRRKGVSGASGPGSSLRAASKVPRPVPPWEVDSTPTYCYPYIST
jgi:hypothetical protein